MNPTDEHLRDISDWERERQCRASACASTLHHANAALAAAAESNAPPNVVEALVFAANGARGHLRSVIEETNPYV